MNQNTLVGGKADNYTLEDIAKKHNVSLQSIQQQFQKGLKIEAEHTTDLEKRTEIAMDHLVEDPLYYDKLEAANLEENKKTIGTFKKFYTSKQQPMLVVVDIQPEYMNYAGKHFAREFCSWLNQNYSTFRSVLFLFNGPELGFPTEQELKYWYLENGLNEEIIENSKFYDKGYAFFRYCMDSGVDEDEIVDLVKFMIKKHINDSRDMTDHWDEFVKEFGKQHARELLEYSEDAINIPDLMDFIRRFGSDLILVGGGEQECLKEVEIALKANNQSYKKFQQMVYESNNWNKKDITVI